MILSSGTPYGLMADVVADLPELMRQARERTGQTLKQQAARASVSTTTLARLDTGANSARTVVVACLRYLAEGH